MLTGALSEALQRFLESRKSHTPLMRFVEELRKRYEQALAQLPRFAEDSSKWPSVSSEIHTVMAQVGTAMRGNPSSAIFKSVDHLHESLSQVPIRSHVEKLSESLRQFAQSLDGFIENSGPSGGISLLQAAHSLGSHYDSFVEMAESVVQVLEPAPVRDGGRLVIAIDDELSLEEMAAFLTAFAALYGKLAEIAQLEGKERELHARKIESGSWWMDLLGNAAVMSLLASLVTAFFAWSYRRFTPDGKAKSLPEKMESVQKALNLREKLKDAGYEVENLDTSIQELEADVARALVGLFEPRKRVRVDDAIYTRIEPVWPEPGTEVSWLAPAPPHNLLPPPEKHEGS